MKRLSGIFRNCQPLDQPEGFYRDALNINIDESLGAITNEKGTTLKDSLESSSKVIGKILLSDQRVVLFSVLTGGSGSDEPDSEIGVFNGEEYTPLVTGQLGFSQSFPIHGESIIDKHGDNIIFWVDGNNSARFLNIDNIPEDITLTQMSLFPSTSKTPLFDLVSVNPSQGNLETGTYHFAIAYKHSDGTLTNFYTAFGPVSIVADEENDYGDVGGQRTSKSITFSLDNLDQSYESILIGVIKNEEGVLDAVELLPELPVSTTQITYTGFESVTPGALEEIQIDKAFYNKPEVVHIHQDSLMLGNLDQFPDIGYQPYANNIKVSLEEHTLEDAANANEPSNNSYKDPVISYRYKGYRRSDVYAIYISWLLKEGGESRAYHIPGREAVGTEKDQSDSGGAILFAENSNTVDEAPATEKDITIRYPTTATAPTGYTQHDTTITVPGGYSETDLAALIGLNVNNDPNANLRIEVDGTGITYISKIPGTDGNNTRVQLLVDGVVDAGTTFSNSDFLLSGGVDGNDEIAGKEFHFISEPDATYEMGYWENRNEYYPDNENWKTLDSNGDEIIAKDLRNSPVRHHHFPDEEFKPIKTVDGSDNEDYNVFGFSLSDVVIPEELEGEVIGYKIYVAERTDINKRVLDQSLVIQSEIADDVYISNYENGSSIAHTVFYLHPFTYLRKRLNVGALTHLQVLGETTFDDTSQGEGDYDSTHFNHQLPGTYDSQESFTVDAKAYIDSTDADETANLLRFGFTNNMNNQYGESKLVVRTPSWTFSGIDKYPLVNLRSHKLDVYNSFDLQNLVFTGYIHTDLENLDSDPIFGGDTYITPYSYRINWRDDTATPDDSFTAIHTLTVESSDNIIYRRPGENPWEIFYPFVDLFDAHKLDYTSGGLPERTESDLTFFDNYLLYNEDYSVLNTFKFPGIFPKINKEPEEYPTRVIRNSDGLRTFLQDDYIDLTRKRGKLKRLTTYNNILLPHMERAIIRTKGAEELKVDDIRAFLGDGDIFGVKPEEFIYVEDGFAGLYDYRHAISTPYGYFFVDYDARKIYWISNDGIQDIGEPIKTILDNNLNSNFILGYDPVREKVFFTNDDFTYSFYPKSKAWVSRHSYQPDIYLHSKKRFFSIKDEEICEHYVGARGSFYGTVYDSIYEYVDNVEPLFSKKIAFLSMKTDVYNSDATPILQKEKTFNQFRILNSYQDTSTLDIEYFKADPINYPLSVYEGNARQTKKNWIINKFRDILNIPDGISSDMEWAYKKRMEDNWHIVTLTKENDDNDAIYLYDTYLGYGKSIR